VISEGCRPYTTKYLAPLFVRPSHLFVHRFKSYPGNEQQVAHDRSSIIESMVTLSKKRTKKPHGLKPAFLNKPRRKDIIELLFSTNKGAGKMIRLIQNLTEKGESAA
jgi:hypothetical protein